MVPKNLPLGFKWVSEHKLVKTGRKDVFYNEAVYWKNVYFFISSKSVNIF